MKILFFAQLRERLKTSELVVTDKVATLGELRHLLQQNGEEWHIELQKGKSLAAVNQTLVDDDHIITKDDEIAFFPPVTGG